MVSILEPKTPKKVPVINDEIIENLIKDKFANLSSSRDNIIVKKLWNNHYRVNIYEITSLTDSIFIQRKMIKSIFIEIIEKNGKIELNDKTKGNNDVKN